MCPNNALQLSQEKALTKARPGAEGAGGSNGGADEALLSDSSEGSGEAVVDTNERVLPITTL